jgi:hypothetical protein
MATLYEVTFAPNDHTDKRETISVVANTVRQVLDYMERHTSAQRITNLSEGKTVCIGCR